MLSAEIEALYQYLPPLTKREDFEVFWNQTLDETNALPLDLSLTPYPYPGKTVAVYQITYRGFGGTNIHGWYLEPIFSGEKKHPCLIHYHGFSGSRGHPADYMAWCMLGLSVIAVDCRGQGGVTRDDAVYHSGVNSSVVTNGILDKEEYYYRRVYMDCLRAIDCAESIPSVDSSRIILEGGSQGGALVMAVSALDNRPILALADVPSSSDLPSRVLGHHGSFGAVTDYIRTHPQHMDQVMETLSYFDTMNMAEKICCPVYASVGLSDPVCPAKMYFATYNRIQSEKHIELYPFAQHEGGGALHMEKKLRYVSDFLNLSHAQK